MRHFRVDLDRSEWSKIPYGIPIGSRASKLVTGAGKPSRSALRYGEHLAMNRYAGRSVTKFKGNYSTRRGVDYEADAAVWYSDQCGTAVKDCGFFTDDLMTYGASPDRLVGIDGLVEIKCQEARGHLDTLRKIDKTGKAPLSFYPQMQMELLASERQWLDLVLYHPAHPSLILRVFRDSEYLKLLMSQINLCVIHRDSVFAKMKKSLDDSGLSRKQLDSLAYAISKPKKDRTNVIQTSY